MFQSLLFSIFKCHLFMFIFFFFLRRIRKETNQKKENEHKRKNNNNLYLYINLKIELVITKRIYRKKKIFNKNHKNNWSDSEHTQSLQNRNDERFGMT